MSPSIGAMSAGSLPKHRTGPGVWLFGVFWTFWVLGLASHSYHVFLNMGGDFDCYYAVGELFRTDLQREIYNGRDLSPSYGYSPLVAPLFTTLTLLPWHASKVLYFIFRIFLFSLWPLLLTLLLPGTRNVNRKTLWAGAAACMIVSPAVYEDLWAGNLNVLFLTLILVAAKCMKESRYKLSALLLTPAAAIKPHYGLFLLPLLFLNPVGTVLTSVAYVGGLLAVALVFFSPSDLWAHGLHWLSHIKQPIAGPQDVNNMSWFGLVTRLFSNTGLTQNGDVSTVHIAQLTPETIAAIALVLKLGILALAGGLFFHAISSRHTTARILLLSSITLLFLGQSPVVWMTYFMLLLFPAYYLCLEFPNRATLLMPLFALGVYFPGGFFQANETLRVYARAYALPQLLLVLAAGLMAYRAFKNQGVRYA